MPFRRPYSLLFAVLATVGTAQVSHAASVLFDNTDLIASGEYGHSPVSARQAAGQTLHFDQPVILETFELYGSISGSPPRPNVTYDFSIAEFVGGMPGTVLYSVAGMVWDSSEDASIPRQFFPNIPLVANTSYIAILSREDYAEGPPPNHEISLLNANPSTGADTYPSGTIYLADTITLNSGAPWTESSRDLVFSFSALVVPIPPAAWLFGSALLGVIGVSTRRSLFPD